MNSHAPQHHTHKMINALPFALPSTGKPSVEDIYPKILDAILEQRITPTSRFTEESLGEAFGASRSTIRRVLARLSLQQVIIVKPDQRAQVAAPDAEQTRQILHARRLTEITLVRLACQQPQHPGLKKLRELIDRERTCSEHDQRGSAIRLSGEFHLRLAEIAGNAPLAQFLGNLVPLTSLAIAQYEAQACRYCAWQEHLEIVEAVERGDTQAAVALMTQHLDHLEAKLLNPLL